VVLSLAVTFPKGESMATVRSLSRNWRPLALVALGLVLGVALTATPASGHITASTAHVVKHMTKFFYTKSKSDARYSPRLFAYIRDDGPDDAANVQYGKGVTGVNDLPGSSDNYVVNFKRSLENCAVQAVAGFGDPSGGNAAATASMASLFIGGHGVSVEFFNQAGTQIDTSFMISAAC
jgi:hypothetical protein